MEKYGDSRRRQSWSLGWFRPPTSAGTSLPADGAPRSPSHNRLVVGEAEAPLLGSPLGSARNPRVGKKRGRRGRASAMRAGLSFVRGFARRDQDCSSPLTLAGGDTTTPAGVEGVS